eukprot:CAMPEP_0197681460 /NCGR_PEP_ID=MMETSP1338-20131121/94979_1 /TAXON_ID=43686 ORGANISM="Pelagodinium beii, Strain RCC1491" /NCGR_SAMPLE_ID=MMETSP1338 /ASSEMBLY_ACC=CAM_ASM_000754 /LENGTH=35 /DNA_ID= /DNA_START= /DNA_END= /DNA_ORIENTATION=
MSFSQSTAVFEKDGRASTASNHACKREKDDGSNLR